MILPTIDGTTAQIPLTERSRESSQQLLCFANTVQTDASQNLGQTCERFGPGQNPTLLQLISLSRRPSLLPVINPRELERRSDHQRMEGWATSKCFLCLLRRAKCHFFRQL